MASPLPPPTSHLPPCDVIAWTDGGCRGNPGPGGWGCLVVNPATRQALERRGGERETTNNRMELMGAIVVLRTLKRDGLRVQIRSDSQYLIKAASEWMPGWKKRGWRRKDGPLLNVELMQELDALLARHLVTWRWVKGHAGDPGNERADQLTNDAMDAVQRGLDPAHEERLTWNGPL